VSIDIDEPVEPGAVVHDNVVPIQAGQK